MANHPGTDVLLHTLNDNYELVDALPYVDPLPNDMLNQVKKMIEDEMKSMVPPRDYLAPLPMPDISNLDKGFMGKELQRISEQKPMPKLSTTRYEVEPPTGEEANDLTEWKRAVDNAKAQLEHSQARLLNLELMQNYGQNAWLKHIADLQIHDEMYRRAADQTKEQVDDINRSRKLAQVSCGNDLRSAQLEWTELSQRNGQILKAIGELEVETERMRQLCANRGILPNQYKD
eukprot:GHVN01087740.1.p2 GENE.GHVN01087740.1~~GHVN01087740.1.p2  ORF type:complete len:243 (-),score=24.49 GHVN01087740.1:2084-2779(-)